MCQSHLHLGFNKINKLIHFHNQKEKFSFKIKNLMKQKQEWVLRGKIGRMNIGIYKKIKNQISLLLEENLESVDSIHY